MYMVSILNAISKIWEPDLHIFTSLPWHTPPRVRQSLVKNILDGVTVVYYNAGDCEIDNNYPIYHLWLSDECSF